MNRKTSAFYVIASIGLLLVGAIIGAVVDPYLPVSLSNTQKGYQSGFNAARTLVENSSVGKFLATPDDVHTLTGAVTAVSGNRVTIHLQSANPFDDPTLADRTIIVDASTTVTKLIPVDPKVLQAEMSNFIATTQGTTTSTKEPPASFTATDASVASIEVGDSINVSAPENIKSMKEFTASSITILLKTATS